MLDLTYFLQQGSTTVSNLLLKYYHRIGLTDREFLLYIQLLEYQQEGKSFPDMTEVSDKMGISTDEIFALIESLLNKHVIALVTFKNEQGLTTDSYDLTPVYKVIENSIQSEKIQDKEEITSQEAANLFDMFEKEFGRPLSPIELETIGYWIEDDKYEVEIIRLALREAVLNQAYSLKYIDRVLLSWERKNLKSKEQVLDEQRKRKKSLSDKNHSREEEVEELPEVPLYNWLDKHNNE